MSKLKASTVRRFLSKARKLPSGCWEWSGYCLKRKWSGYGIITQDRKQYRAHRYSWLVHFGDIPNGACVLHRCDNHACVNPAHLFLGTRKDNNADRDGKGRGAVVVGERNGRSKLTSKKAGEIKYFLQGGFPLSDIARKYGVRWQTVQAIAQGRTWKNA